MQLTNYWWLLIWVIVGGFILDRYMPKETITVMGKREQRWRLGPAIALVMPYIVWAGFRADGFGDTGAYRNSFRNIPSVLSEIPSYLETITKDKGYSVLAAALKLIFGDSDIIFFLILATIQIICLVIVLRKYSSNYWMSIFLFIASTEYLSWMHNGIRQFTAVMIIFAATDLILKRKYVPLIGVILLASTIHGSALLMIPIVFIIQGNAWNKKTVLCIMASIAVLFFVEQFISILDTLLSDTQYTSMVSDWQSWNDDGTNPIRVFVFSIPTLLSIIGLKIIKHENNPVINMATNASIITTGLYLVSMVTSGIFMGRLPIYVSLYSMCILLPWEIENLFTRDSARLVQLIASGCYVIFFYYQMHFTWGLI